MFKLVGSTSLDLKPQTMWFFHSERAGAFIVGDENRAFAVAESNPASYTPLASEAKGACNLPIPAALYDEFARQPWHGFRFPDRDACEKFADGDLLRTLVFGPDYGHPVIHNASGSVLALRGGSMQLLDPSFAKLDQTKTRGKAALAFAAHPSEPLIVYGDNYGVFHAHRFDPAAGKFAKAAKIVDKQRKAGRIEFALGGTLLVIGGMGYLATLTYADSKFTPLHELSIAVRDFHWHDDGAERVTVVVNRGLHGIGAYRYDVTGGFALLGEMTPSEGALGQTGLSHDGRRLCASVQSTATVIVFRIEAP